MMPTLFRLSISLIACGVLVASPALAEPLKGQVQLQNKLDRLTEANPVGQFEQVSNKWFAIPSWLAGSWESLSRLQTNEIDERNKKDDPSSRTINESRLLVFGWQKDKSGEAWQRADEIKYREVKDSSKDSNQNSGTKDKSQRQEIDQCSVAKLIRESADEVVIERTDCKPRYSSSGKWQSAERTQSLSTFKLINPDLVVEESQVRQYDSDGLPLKTRTMFALLRRKQEFQALDRIGDVDMRASFHRFLSDTNRINKIPH